MDDWASDGEEVGLGDISALPTVEAPQPPSPPLPPPPSSQQPQPQSQPEKQHSSSVPPVNAWTAANQSGDVRSATRSRHPMPNNVQHRSMPRRDAFPLSQDTRMRPPSDIRPRPQSAPGFGPPRQSAIPAVTLYVSSLPFDTNEAAIASFFARCGVTIADVRITRHNDTGNVKAAFVNVRDSFRMEALALDGKQFGSRPIHVKIDGEDRGTSNRDSNRSSGSRDRERPGYGFGNRERREVPDIARDRVDRQNSTGGRETGWSTGQWVDRPAKADTRSNPTGREGRMPGGGSGGSGGVVGREGRGGSRGEGSTEQRMDPTIPTGPPPAGRKKLMLKPRTKPPPVLEVDKRAIDGPRPLSAPPAVSPTANARAEPNEKSQSGAAFVRKGSGGRSERWGNQKEAVSSPRSPSTQSMNKKDEDSKRPVLLNTFAALEINDSDV